nr:DNA primase small subunit-like [Ipomoea batatas]
MMCRNTNLDLYVFSTEDFGFNHILWVYSGRCGVHCWVCDLKARRLNNEQRAAVADYFRVYKGNENSNRKVSLMGPALHPFLVWEQLKHLLQSGKHKAQGIRRCVEEIVFSFTYPKLDREVLFSSFNLLISFFLHAIAGY